MPVEMTTDADIANRYDDISLLGAVQRNTFVDDRAVSRCPLQSLAHHLRGSRYIIEPADLPKIGLEGKTEAEKIVVQVTGDEVEKVNLITNSETGARVVDLKKGHMRLLQSWSDIKPRRLRLCVSEPGQGTARRCMCTHMPVATTVHAGSSRFYQISAASDRPDMQGQHFGR